MAALCWSSREEIPRAQGKRNPSKTVGVARGHQREDTLKPLNITVIQVYAPKSNIEEAEVEQFYEYLQDL